MNREDFIKFIPKPSNKDVILYDISLSDLIEEDVLHEYEKLYPIFELKKNKYNEIKERLTEYKNLINSIYLFKPSWSEEDYLQNLQNDKKTYSILFGEIKKIENNIEMFQKKLKSINEKLLIQTTKENKVSQEKKEETNKEIQQNKEKLLSLKQYLDFYELAFKDINLQIDENNKQFNLLIKMQDKAEEGKCKCEFCGRTIKTTDENSVFFNRLIKNIEKNKEILEKLLNRKEKIETNLSYYRTEVKNIKEKLNNIIQFNKENDKFYHKKTIDVLKLEALRDETLNNISKSQKELESNIKTKSTQYLDLKSNIQKYELSLDNLKKIKELKHQSNADIEQFNVLKEELKIMFKKIQQYIKFIQIYYKILEQKASTYCGLDYKFKFYRIEEYKIIPILEIDYKGIQYSELNKKDMDKVDKYLAEKFSIYS